MVSICLLPVVLPERLSILLTPIRFPSAMPLSPKKDPVDSLSESVEEKDDELLEEPVTKVLKEIDPETSRFLTKPTLIFKSCKPSGHPSSCLAMAVALPVSVVQ